ncbi:MAG: hypothetical protein L3K26_15385 [Candidatus Hydrogenedentes bacterium]|nr:hypothetical protein [Candidatus Hydrogenedentota bacterium]
MRYVVTRDGLAPPASAWWRLRVGEQDAVGEGVLCGARAWPGGLWGGAVLSERQPPARSIGLMATSPCAVA